MFNVNYKNLRLSFNDFHEFTDKDMPSDHEGRISGGRQMEQVAA